MKQSCRCCGVTFRIEREDLEFYCRVSPGYLGASYTIPPPKLCPDCRLRRRLTWRNEYCYYRRTCDLCSKNIVSVHSTDKPYPVFCSSCWWSDNWSPLEFGSPFDPSRRFFDQYVEVYSKVPQLAMMNDHNVGSENSEYCQDISQCKDCYLLTGSWHCRDVYYSTNCNHSRDLGDCDSVNLNCELVYQSTDSQHLYNCSYLQYSANCNDCHFGFDLRGCKDCFGSVGLRQKQFYFFNQELKEVEYRAKVSKYLSGSFELQTLVEKRFSEHLARYPRKAVHQINCESSNGDNLFNCRNVLAFDTFNAEHCRYFYKGDSPKNCYDVYQSGNPQWCYESLTPDDSYLACFTTWCWKGNRQIYYCDNCHTSENLFGCIGLKRHKHCVLNVQYSEEDFVKLTQTIIDQMIQHGDWGEFFPETHSPFAYNETVAHEMFPLSQEQSDELGLKWRESDPSNYKPTSFVLPDNISEVTAQLTKEVLACSNCSKNYKILEKELALYQKMNLAIPRQCSDCRRKARWNKRNPYKLWDAACHGCASPIKTVYSDLDRHEIYCEPCYLNLVM